MIKIVITRHGRYDRLPGQNDGRLTDAGAEEIQRSAIALKKSFARQRITNGQIFCSPLIRSKETADVFKKDLEWNSDIIEDPRIADPRMDIDIHLAMVGSSICNPSKLSTGEVYMLMQQPNGFEVYEEVAQRFSDFVQKLTRASEDEAVIVVTHAPAVDYLLFQIFHTGLCEGRDLGYGEFLTMSCEKDDNFVFEFRGMSEATDSHGMLFHPQALAEERRRRGYGR